MEIKLLKSRKEKKIYNTSLYIFTYTATHKVACPLGLDLALMWSPSSTCNALVLPAQVTIKPNLALEQT